MKVNIKKKISIIYSILFVIIIGFILLIMFNVTLAKFRGNQPRIFGYSFHIVLTDSMSPDIMPGDFITSVIADKQNIEIGNYIIFASPDPNLKGITIVHKVIDKYVLEGEIFFETSGIKEGATPDSYPVKDIIGKYSFKSVILGRIIAFALKVENLLFLAAICAIFFVIKQQIQNIINIKNEEKENDNKSLKQ